MAGPYPLSIGFPMIAISPPRLSAVSNQAISTDYAARADKIIRAGHVILTFLDGGKKIRSHQLRDVRIDCFDGSDAEGLSSDTLLLM